MSEPLDSCERPTREVSTVIYPPHRPAVVPTALVPSVTAFVIHLHDVDRCPTHSLLPAHYRPDGSCLHEHPDPETEDR